MLPPPDEMHPLMQSEPDQQLMEGEDFTFTYRDNDYLVRPLRYYEIYGLVVTHNNIHSITDAYHSSDSVDVKDLCVIWGDNVSNAIYQKGEFWSAPWTCWYKFADGNDYKQFNGAQLSNTHLLSQRESVREAIHKMTVGDQIRLRGMLIGYAPADRPNPMRTSSLIRTDTGNGACEVMMVDEAEVIKEGNVFWRRTHTAARTLATAGVVITPLLWLFLIFHQQSLVNKELKDAQKRMARRAKRSKRV